MNKIEEVKRDFEANLLDGDKINDCGRAMLSTKYIWEWLEPKLQEVYEQGKKEGEKEEKDRIIEILQLALIIPPSLTKE